MELEIPYLDEHMRSDSSLNAITTALEGLFIVLLFFWNHNASEAFHN